MDKQITEKVFKGIRSQKQIMFILFYCNPESISYDNGSESYFRAYNSKNHNVSAVEAHKLLGQDKIQKSMDLYRAYIHEMNGFQLDWLDNHLRNLYYKVQNDDDSPMELRILKTIGDRIGAFQDQHTDNVGKMVEMTPDQEKLANKVFNDYIAAIKRDAFKQQDKMIQVKAISQELEN